jgi:hypothetical protein
MEFLVKKLKGCLNIKTLIVGTKNLRTIADNSCSEPNRGNVIDFGLLHVDPGRAEITHSKEKNY